MNSIYIIYLEKGRKEKKYEGWKCKNKEKWKMYIWYAKCFAKIIYHMRIYEAKRLLCKTIDILYIQ